MALVGRYVYRHDTGQRHFGSIEEKVIHRYFLLLYFRNFCGIWVYAEKNVVWILKSWKSSIWKVNFSL